jgi:hypothetical protein
MASQSGKFGQVIVGGKTIAYANHWTMDDSVEASQFGIFGGDGWKLGNVGQRFATGTIEGAYDFASGETIEDFLYAGRIENSPGTQPVTLLLYLSTTGTVPTRSDRYFTVPCQITGISYDVDGDTGEKVGWSATWQSSGAITDPT